MVLGRTFSLAIVVSLGIAAGGCKQSLFDSHGDDTSHPDADMPVPQTCQEPCVGDAAGDFDGTAAGRTGHWRYLDDHRDRTWLAMTPDADLAMIGADASNTIATCTSRDNAGPCAQLPNALLVTTSGMTSAADPSVELTIPSNQVVQLSVLARVADDGADQTIRLYRNSREDVLVTSTATAGTTLEKTITVDALAGDRFLVAVAPSAAGGQVALHVFASSTGAAFPAQCQVGVNFSNVAGTDVTNPCGSNATFKDATATPAAPTLGAGPFSESGSAVNLAVGAYLETTAPLERTGDTTTQLWVNFDPATLDGVDAEWPFSDYDLDNGGGLGMAIYTDSSDNVVKLEVSTCSSPSPLSFDGDSRPFPIDHQWHFIRAVHTGGNVLVCVDGRRAFSFPLETGKLVSAYPPFFGKNVRWTPAGAYYGGGIDDVRVFSTALPCE